MAKYIYFEEGKEPTPEDIVHSEVVEGRIREGFVRIRQLLVKHSLPVHIMTYTKISEVLTVEIGHDAP